MPKPIILKLPVAPRRKRQRHWKRPTKEAFELGMYGYFRDKLKSTKTADPVVHALHRLMFPSRQVTKKGLLTFQGFPKSELNFRKEKMTNSLLWTTEMLSTALSLFGLPQKGSRSAMIDRLLAYLADPRIIISNDNNNQEDFADDESDDSSLIINRNPRVATMNTRLRRNSVQYGSTDLVKVKRQRKSTVCEDVCNILESANKSATVLINQVDVIEQPKLSDKQVEQLLSAIDNALHYCYELEETIDHIYSKR